MIALIFTISYSSSAIGVKDIYITADNLTVDYGNNSNIFEGNVIVSFGDITIKTAKIEIYWNENPQESPSQPNHKISDHKAQLKKIIIRQFFTAKITSNKDFGKNFSITKPSPARYSPPNVITAYYAEYNPVTDELTFENNVEIQQATNYISCNKFIYKVSSSNKR